MVNSNLVRLANQLIPRADNKNLPIIPNGSTQDIVNEVLGVYGLSKSDLVDFAKVLRGDTIEDTCSNIWHFIKKNIRYKEDPAGVQWIKTPARIWQDKVCDCKGYSIFTACLLYALDIKGSFRFVGYERFEKSVTHVYVVVPGKKNIVIDCVLDRFDTEKKYAHKKDYAMTQISRLSGIGCPGNPDCGCANKANQSAVLKMESVPQTATQMALTSAIYKPNLYLTPEALADNLLLLERLKIELDIEAKQDNWNDIRLAMYQEAMGRVKTRIQLLESGDTKIAGGLLKKVLSSGKRKAIDDAFNTNPELGFIFLYAFIPNGEAFRNSNTRNLMAQMPSAVQAKAKLQQELWNYLENQSQYGHEAFGTLTRNAAIKVLGRSPEQFLSEALGIGLTEGERWWYGSSFPIIRGIGGTSGLLNLYNKVTDAAGKQVPLGDIAAKVGQFGMKIFASLFGKKNVIESAFGISIPPNLDPSKIGPDFESDFGVKLQAPDTNVALPPIKEGNTLVNQILDMANKGTQTAQSINDTGWGTQTNGSPAPEEKSNMTPLLLGGSAFLAYMIFK